jgi:hypothetical protein
MELSDNTTEILIEDFYVYSNTMKAFDFIRE